MKDKTSYTASKTREYDDQAMKVLLIVLAPLVLGYSVYSLFQREHRGWYTWILNTAATMVYAFGFALMTPQLFINYKLKVLFFFSDC